LHDIIIMMRCPYKASKQAFDALRLALYPKKYFSFLIQLSIISHLNWIPCKWLRNNKLQKTLLFTITLFILVLNSKHLSVNEASLYQEDRSNGFLFHGP